MKRVIEACLYQTLGFILDPTLPVLEAKAKVLLEVNNYKEFIKPESVQILDEISNNDGSVIIKLRKKVSNYPVGSYYK